MDSVAIGLRAQKGGAVAVALALEAGKPRILLSTTLETHAPDDRLSFEPYRIASDIVRDKPGADAAAAAVAEGRKRQDRLAARGLQALIDRLKEAGHEPVAAALLVNRAGWITDHLSYSLAWPEHVPVAELLGVRDALRFAFRECAIEAMELDEKSLPEVAAARLALLPAQVEARLKDLGASAGKPWRKEQKRAGLAAWIAALEHHPPAPAGS